MNQTQLTTRRRLFAMLVSGLFHTAVGLLLLRVTYPERPVPPESRMSLVFTPVMGPVPAAPPTPLAVALPAHLKPLRFPQPPPQTQFLMTEPSALSLPEEKVAPLPLDTPGAYSPQLAPKGGRFTTEAVAPAPPVPKPPAQVGSFAAGFINAPESTPKIALLRLGSFEGGPRPVEPNSAPHGEVMSSGFAGPSDRTNSRGGQSVVHMGATQPPGAFGSVEATSIRSERNAPVGKTHFDAVTLAANTGSTTTHSGSVTAQTALEILQKPVPVYTSEALLHRVEGAVLLEALFNASGQVRVLRVTRGLGYGLDEKAIQAATNIRFRPATEGGQPVDTVATVRIDFQLAY